VKSSVTIAANPGCELAENPIWHPVKQCVYWTDIPAGKIYCFDHRTRQCRLLYHGPPVGGFTIQEDDTLLLFRVSDIACLHSDGRVCSLKTFSEEGTDRFNDVTADPEGRVFAGTIGRNPDNGLYRMDLDGTITKLFSGTGCSNGMGFSPELKIFYWTCSTTRRIYEFDYDRLSGSLSNRRLFYESAPDEGVPDGLTVDAEGYVWSARWGGAAVLRHAPDGSISASIELPVPNITSVCFGGENLQLLFITTAREEGKAGELAGALFETRLNVGGIRELRSRIQLG
jgi:D-xylono/L-arabinono-1,4-lactonase